VCAFTHRRLTAFRLGFELAAGAQFNDAGSDADDLNVATRVEPGALQPLSGQSDFRAGSCRQKSPSFSIFNRRAGWLVFALNSGIGFILLQRRT
jgi:hypothetical protein